MIYQLIKLSVRKTHWPWTSLLREFKNLFTSMTNRSMLCFFGIQPQRTFKTALNMVWKYLSCIILSMICNSISDLSAMFNWQLKFGKEHTIGTSTCYYSINSTSLQETASYITVLQHYVIMIPLCCSTCLAKIVLLTSRGIFSKL